MWPIIYPWVQLKWREFKWWWWWWSWEIRYHPLRLGAWLRFFHPFVVIADIVLFYGLLVALFEIDSYLTTIPLLDGYIQGWKFWKLYFLESVESLKLYTVDSICYMQECISAVWNALYKVPECFRILEYIQRTCISASQIISWEYPNIWTQEAKIRHSTQYQFNMGRLNAVPQYIPEIRPFHRVNAPWARWFRFVPMEPITWVYIDVLGKKSPLFEITGQWDELPGQIKWYSVTHYYVFLS